MQPFNEYIAGERATVTPKELDRLTSRHEWFTTARRAKSLLTGKGDPALELPMMFWPTIPPSEKGRAHMSIPCAGQPETASATVDTTSQADSAPAYAPPIADPDDDIIGKFLEHGGYRIVPDEDSDVAEAVTSEIFDGADDELLTEELAEIYRSQGLAAEAKEIYRKLSLLNPEKSIYFADIIAEIDTENNK